jgi:hypothetical protein
MVEGRADNAKQLKLGFGCSKARFYSVLFFLIQVLFKA